MKVIICGGRDYCNEYAFGMLMDAIHRDRPIHHVIQGGASGADRLAAEWAEPKQIKCTEVPAKWGAHGKEAGLLEIPNMPYEVKEYLRADKR